jgi:hypothetical protein
MKRAHLTALVATLAMGAVAAPRLAAQDTSGTAGRARQDTSGYTGAGGVDTSGAADTGTGRQAPSSLRDAPGHVDAADTTGALGATDTSGMRGRHADTVHVGDTNPARPPRHATDTGAAGARSGDTTEMTQPTTQPSQSTSPSGRASDSTRSQ